MANPLKKTLSKNLSQMKFMKRRSHGTEGREETDSGAVLTEKWVVSNAPPPVKGKQGTKRLESFVECEDLNRLGRFSYNNFNKEVERLVQYYADGAEGVSSDMEDEGEAIPAREVARRYEEITSKKLLGKRKRGEGQETHLERMLSEPTKHRGFLRPS